MCKLPVLKIQRFSTHDGPGIRTTVFLQGCPLRCVWCHNPESQSTRPQFFFRSADCIQCGKCAELCPENVHYFENGAHRLDREKCVGCMCCTSICPANALESVFHNVPLDDILAVVEKDRVFYEKTGGLTLSGGEPLLHGNTTVSLLKSAKLSGISTAVETCGFFDNSLIPELIKNVDLFLFDLKDTNQERHKKHTGASVDKILQNLFAIDQAGGTTILRCILLKGINDDFSHLETIAKIYHQLNHCLYIELFSYHHYSEGKYTSLGKTYAGKKAWILSENDLKTSANFLKKQNVPCKIHI